MYETGYKPTHLSQWEVPKTFQEYPKRREGYTIPIADENGHFLPYIRRPVFKEWSNYEGTWDKNYPRPGKVIGTSVKPGYWMIKGARARWVEAKKISDNYFDAFRS